jgi:CRISPR-associated protein Cas1
MRKLLNTLYITTTRILLKQGRIECSSICKARRNIQNSHYNLESIITFGYMGASPGLMKLCSDNNVFIVIYVSFWPIYRTNTREH